MMLWILLLTGLGRASELPLPDSLAAHGWTNDIGGYYGSQLLSFSDDRIRIYNLLGAHVQNYPAPDGTAWSFSLPQGLEIHIPDAIAPSWWIRAGAFVQPTVQDASYYQGYLRTGPVTYVELNYIQWTQTDYSHQRLSGMSGSQLIGFL